MERNEFKKALLNKVSEVSDINTEQLEVVLTLGEALREFLATIDQFAENTTGFSTCHFKVLRMLYVRFPNGVPISQLAEHVEVTRTSMTQIINNFEKRLLVERAENPNDKRSSLISLTPKGMEEVAVSFVKSHSVLADLADKAGTKKMEDTSVLIAELSQHLKDVMR